MWGVQREGEDFLKLGQYHVKCSDNDDDSYDGIGDDNDEYDLL